MTATTRTLVAIAMEEVKQNGGSVTITSGSDIKFIKVYRDGNGIILEER